MSVNLPVRVFLDGFYGAYPPNSFSCTRDGHTNELVRKLACQMLRQCCLAGGYTTVNEGDILVSFKQLIKSLVLPAKGKRASADLPPCSAVAASEAFGGRSNFTLGGSLHSRSPRGWPLHGGIRLTDKVSLRLTPKPFP